MSNCSLPSHRYIIRHVSLTTKEYSLWFFFFCFNISTVTLRKGTLYRTPLSEIFLWLFFFFVLFLFNRSPYSVYHCLICIRRFIIVLNRNIRLNPIVYNRYRQAGWIWFFYVIGISVFPYLIYENIIIYSYTDDTTNIYCLNHQTEMRE